MVGAAMGLQKGESDRGIATSLTNLADGIGKLVTQHLTLARMELAEDAKVVGTQVAKIAAFVPFVLVGYALLCVAVAVALAQVLPMAAAFAIVGGVNVIAGTIGILIAAQSLKKRELLDESRQALEGTRGFVKRTMSGEVPAPQLTSETPHAR